MAATETPDAKAQQYDRQLRVWGDHGQAALEGAKLLLINAGATGTEIMKNLTLPGVGHFTVLDGGIVTGADVGCNFFLTPDSIGKSRAEESHILLKELNPFVEGVYNNEDPSKVIAEQPDYFDQFSIVIATELSEADLLKLDAILCEKNIPLLIARTYGFFGYVRTVTREHCIIESHPDNAFEDLRITEPFPELLEHVASHDFSALPPAEFGHVPYPIVLIRHLEEWKAEHDGQRPSNREEKDAFRQILKDACGGDTVNVANYGEAVKKHYRAYNPTELPSESRNIFADPRAANVTETSDDFWVLAKAVSEFMDNEGGGLPPLVGTLSDMVGTSERFIALQEIYKAKAQEDYEAVLARTQAILSDIGRPADAISDDVVKRFCKNVFNLKVIEGRSLAEEYSPETAHKENLAGWLSEEESNASVYVILRAVDAFTAAEGHVPGAEDSEIDGDFSKLKAIVETLLSDLGITGNVSDDLIREACRYAGAEIHGTAAFVGGVAAQELVKLISHQYVLMDNTFVFNGITSAASVYRL